MARAERDGHTILFGTSGPLAINVSLYKKIGYDPVKSFAPVIQIGHLPNVLVVNPSIPAKNVKELIAYGKANPGKLSYASSGNGASSHRRMMVELAGGYRGIASPIKLSRTPATYRFAPLAEGETFLPRECANDE